MFLSLRPNCLLTRYPILMMTSDQGWSEYLRPSRYYRRVLAAHGYQVQHLSLTASQGQNNEMILNHLRKFKQPLHLLCDQHIRAKLDLTTLPEPTLASVTTLYFAKVTFKTLWRAFAIQQKKLWRDQILNLAISLAENDLKRSQ